MTDQAEQARMEKVISSLVRSGANPNEAREMTEQYYHEVRRITKLTAPAKLAKYVMIAASI
ncbi:hypothetical protein [Alterisphingorhabdus coralli]|uniref:Uncharacterized protein n=1 Tax=Alterisphingorhabdus coralli TaxID=3071408 RepID=A0AA97FA03_9SPHN|nr:hypothetical protein [Parasphingorhabdus sp. SCSIO 66989]WOE76723.1 hypothetical protein RB602_15165 [Parasphingorhabdus sp. SCSIO 66989]